LFVPTVRAVALRAGLDAHARDAAAASGVHRQHLRASAGHGDALHGRADAG